MFVRVYGTRTVSQRCDFVFDAAEDMSLNEITEMLNSPENFCKLHDCVDYIDEGSEATPFKVTRNKKRVVLDDHVITAGELCQMN